MSFVAAAIGGGAIISGATGIMGANKQSDAARYAADQQAQAMHESNQLQEKMYNQNRADQEPWRQAGTQALSQMQDPSFQHNFSASDFQADPGYQFRMDEANKAIQRSAAASGGLQSGGTLKALAQYNQNFASNEYQNAYNRFTNDQSNRFNRLSSLAGVGQTANNQLASAGQNYAGQVGQNLSGLANAQGAAGIARGNAWAGAANGVANAATGAANNWMGMTMMNRMGGNPFGSGTVGGSYGHSVSDMGLGG